MKEFVEELVWFWLAVWFLLLEFQVVYQLIQNVGVELRLAELVLVCLENLEQFVNQETLFLRFQRAQMEDAELQELGKLFELELIVHQKSVHVLKQLSCNRTQKFNRIILFDKQFDQLYNQVNLVQNSQRAHHLL